VKYQPVVLTALGKRIFEVLDEIRRRVRNMPVLADLEENKAQKNSKTRKI